MSKLMDIIDRRFDERLEKMGVLMKYVPAVVTDVQEDYLRADVKLIANNAEIKGMLNKTAEKLTVGQTVTVGYQTMPSSGVILLANGEADPIREGGGVAVENAVLFDEDDLHEYTVDNELMVDISANTKLYYGGTGNMIVAQGMLCYFGSRTLSGSNFTDALDTLLTQNSEYISPEYTGITSYYVNTSHVVFKYEVDIRVYPYEINVAQTNNQVRWWFRIESTRTITNMSTSAVTVSTTKAEVNFNTADITDITDYGLILVSQYAGASSPDAYLNSYIPNGYIGSNTSSPSTSAVAAMLVYKNSNQAVNKWNANYAGTISNLTYTSLGAASYMPLSAGETVFAMGATQRSEPVSGGGA